MYSWAPRWSEAWSSRRVPACCRLPPSSAAKAVPIANRPKASVATAPRREIVLVIDLVMDGRHSFRNRLGPIDLGPKRHGDEEHEVEEGQHASDDRLDRVGTRAGADLAQPHEAHREHQQHRPRDPAAVAVGLD